MGFLHTILVVVSGELPKISIVPGLRLWG